MGNIMGTCMSQDFQAKMNTNDTKNSNNSCDDIISNTKVILRDIMNESCKNIKQNSIKHALNAMISACEKELSFRNGMECDGGIYYQILKSAKMVNTIDQNEVITFEYIMDLSTLKHIVQSVQNDSYVEPKNVMNLNIKPSANIRVCIGLSRSDRIKNTEISEIIHEIINCIVEKNDKLERYRELENFVGHLLTSNMVVALEYHTSDRKISGALLQILSNTNQIDIASVPLPNNKDSKPIQSIHFGEFRTINPIQCAYIRSELHNAIDFLSILRSRSIPLYQRTNENSKLYNHDVMLRKLIIEENDILKNSIEYESFQTQNIIQRLSAVEHKTEYNPIASHVKEKIIFGTQPNAQLFCNGIDFKTYYLLELSGWARLSRDHSEYVKSSVTSTGGHIALETLVATFSRVCWDGSILVDCVTSTLEPQIICKLIDVIVSDSNSKDPMKEYVIPVLHRSLVNLISYADPYELNLPSISSTINSTSINSNKTQKDSECIKLHNELCSNCCKSHQHIVLNKGKNLNILNMEEKKSLLPLADGRFTISPSVFNVLCRNTIDVLSQTYPKLSLTKLLFGAIESVINGEIGSVIIRNILLEKDDCIKMLSHRLQIVKNAFIFLEVEHSTLIQIDLLCVLKTIYSNTYYSRFDALNKVMCESLSVVRSIASYDVPHLFFDNCSLQLLKNKNYYAKLINNSGEFVKINRCTLNNFSELVKLAMSNSYDAADIALGSTSTTVNLMPKKLLENILNDLVNADTVEFYKEITDPNTMLELLICVYNVDLLNCIINKNILSHSHGIDSLRLAYKDYNVYRRLKGERSNEVLIIMRYLSSLWGTYNKGIDFETTNYKRMYTEIEEISKIVLIPHVTRFYADHN